MFRYSEEKCTNELDRILKTSPKVAVLLKGIQTLNKNALSRGITCRPCIGTNQEVINAYALYCSAIKLLFFSIVWDTMMVDIKGTHIISIFNTTTCNLNSSCMLIMKGCALL